MWQHKHLLEISHLSAQDIEDVFVLAERFLNFMNRGVRKFPALKDYSMVTLFFEPSTRTRISFELSARNLSANVIHFDTSSSSLQKGETLYDTLKTLDAMGFDFMVVRHKWIGAPHWIARNVSARVINAGDGTHAHPTQALLDAFTIKYFLGTLQDVRIAIVGDILHSRVARSDTVAFLKLGAEVMLCGPPALLPAQMKREKVLLTYNIDEALNWADVVIALRLQKERQKQGLIPSLKAYNRDYGLTPERLSKIGRKIWIMHPGPMNPGVEIEPVVAESNVSWILSQVKHGVAVRMALLYLLAQVKN